MKTKNHKGKNKLNVNTHALDTAHEADTVLKSAQKFWDELIDNIENSESDVRKQEPLSQLNYIAEVEEARTSLLNEIQEIERLKGELDKEHLNDLSEQEKSFIESVKSEINSFLKNTPRKVQDFLETYQELIEEVLNQIEEIITRLSDKVMENKTVNKSKEMRMDLDYEEELSELKDTLESIREIRLKSGESEEEDPILRILDSLITTCDNSLLIEESNQ
jgi:hypothetical protein